MTERNLEKLGDGRVWHHFNCLLDQDEEVEEKVKEEEKQEDKQPEKRYSKQTEGENVECSRKLNDYIIKIDSHSSLPVSVIYCKMVYLIVKVSHLVDKP